MGHREDGITLYNNGLYKDALDALMCEDIDPVEDPELAYLMGLCYTRLEEYNAAVFYLENSSEHDSSLIRIYQSRMVLSYVYNLTGNFSAAEDQLRKVIKDGFESCQIYSSLGYALWSQDRTDECVDALARSLEMDEENANTLNSMGYIMADKGLNPEKAVEYCRKAHALKPENGNYMDSLAWALFRTGEIEEAKSFLEKAGRAGADKEALLEHLSTINKYDKF